MSNGIMKNIDGTFKGEIRTMKLCLSFYLQPILGKKSQSSPDYDVIARSPLGHTCQVGVAWERTMKRGDNVGQSMFSFQLSDPDFGDSEIYFNAFPSNDGYSITFERKRGQSSVVGGDAVEDKAAA